MNTQRARCVLGLLVIASFLCIPDLGAEAPANPMEHGITPNSTDDQTAAIQKYLDSVAERGGGRATLEAGQYIIRGSLTVPTGVTLVGAWEQPHHGILTKGTVFMAYGGRGQEDGPALIELSQSSGVRGITICHPEQTLADPQPYPWAVRGRGMHCTVENVTLVNAWQGIAMGPQHNELHLIRNVFGCVLRRGIFIDNTTDIGRIENVHFNPHYWPRSGHDGVPPDAKPNPDIAVGIFMQKNLEAFIFGRTDWQSVRDTFVFAANIGYHFVATGNGACNGQLAGIGADMCQYAVVADAAQGPGILISNGQFVTGPLSEGVAPCIGIVTSPGFDATLQLSNCSFWGPNTTFARIEGTGLFTLSQARLENCTGPAIELLGGRAVIRDAWFVNARGAHVVVGKDIRRGVVESNFADGGVKIENNAGAKLVAQDNEE